MIFRLAASLVGWVKRRLKWPLVGFGVMERPNLPNLEVVPVISISNFSTQILPLANIRTTVIVTVVSEPLRN